MTPTTDTHPTTAQNVMGFALFFTGLGGMVWMKLDPPITWPGILLSFIVSGAGAWIVAAPRLAGYVEAVEHVAATVQQARGGQLNVAQPADTSVVVERPAAPDVVVPPQADPVVMRDRAAPVDRLAYNTTDTIRLTALPDPSTPRRRRRKTDEAPPLAAAQEHPPYTPPAAPVAPVPADEDEGVL